MFVQYGFIIEGNALDRIQWPIKNNNTTTNNNNDKNLSTIKIEISIKALDTIINDFNMNINNIKTQQRYIAVRESLIEGLKLIHYNSNNITIIEALLKLYDQLISIEGIIIKFYYYYYYYYY